MGQLTGTPIRRRRFFLGFLAIVCIVGIYLFGFSEESHDGSTSSRAKIAKLVADKLTFSSTKKTPVDEIYGLIHLVTRDGEKSERVLTSGDLQLSEPMDVSVYAEKRGIQWEKEREKLNEVYPLVVFSKTYCPFSRKAKQLLETYQLSPPPKIIEVDLREDAPQLKAILTRLTRRSTFPNVLLRGKSIGGSDDVHALHSGNALRAMFEDAGIEVLGDYT
ncbi:thioredoxin-like protein [Gymnopus androsaceus JB14]|uniref:Thioredoxin-like protein n=1 Tax=Gymnopus androsaceus JB14 TaxID=1447944 RepID=A0A6A4IF80_9AGAR|nr:thioredoxin-like protein [Gymnopus androsaceus JB14]